MHTSVEDTAGVYLEVEVNGDTYAVDRADEGAIDVAYRAWHLEGKNTILTLTHWCGDEWVVAASLISNFSLSTPEGRMKQREWNVQRDRLRSAAERADGWNPDAE